MRRLGQVLHVSRSGNIILRIKNVPKIGTTVVDENLKSIGKVVDVFGPVSSPYASVKPAVGEIEKLTDEILYVRQSKRKRGKQE